MRYAIEVKYYYIFSLPLPLSFRMMLKRAFGEYAIGGSVLHMPQQYATSFNKWKRNSLDGCGCCSLLFFFEVLECSFARWRKTKWLTDALTLAVWKWLPYRTSRISFYCNSGHKTVKPICNSSNNHHFYIKCTIFYLRLCSLWACERDDGFRVHRFVRHILLRSHRF